MNKEALESKVADLFNKSEDEKSAVFSLFKENIASYLKVGEAIRIEGLGVFQLKEQLANSDSEKPLHSVGKSKTLVFSPESGEISADSPFINLELDNKQKDDTEFDESVFQLGIGKPLATISDKSSLNEEIVGGSTDALEKSISILLNDSEKLKDFDLWEDHLKNKETKSILDEETILDEVVDSVTEEDAETSNQKSLLDDFEPLGEKEILDNYIEDNDFINDENVNKIVDEIDKTDIEFEIPTDELESEDFNVVQKDEFDDASIDTQDILDELNEDTELAGEEIKEDVSDQLEKVELDKSIDENIDNDITEDMNIENAIKELESTLENEEINVEDSEIKIDEEIVEQKIPSFKKEQDVRYIQTKRRKSPIIYLLIAAFVIIGAIGIYYLFFDNPTWLYDEHEVEVQLSQQHAKELEEARLKALNEQNPEVTSSNENDKVIDEQNADENSKKNTEEKISSEKKDVIAIAKETKTEPKKSTSNVLDDEVSENIYFDGFVYNVQVSSWKQEKFAKLEVSKLVKKGLPAFFVKVFIPKFNSYWHRVRLGPYSTLEEAKKNQKKL